MNRNSLLAALWIGAVALLAATPVSAIEESASVTGKIVKIGDGNVTAVPIRTPEGDIPISNEGKGKELVDHVGATVDITVTFNDNLSINVISYKIKEPN